MSDYDLRIEISNLADDLLDCAPSHVEGIVKSLRIKLTELEDFDPTPYEYVEKVPYDTNPGFRETP